MVDAFNRMGGKNKERFELFCNAIGCDGCHPTDLGYTEIAALIYKELFISKSVIEPILLALKIEG